MKNIVGNIVKKTIDNGIQETITVALPDPQNDGNKFRPITLDLDYSDFTPVERLTPIYIKDDYVVQDPQNMETKIHLKRKIEPSENKTETKKLIRENCNNYVNINCNIELVEIKSLSQDEVEFVKKVPSHPRNSPK